ncbi:hypothetical protein [Roseibium algae]|uniref:Uncharacterized protein n=1 Tax=Roseibium algae TaxID=3123038 RepID=A0ABU8TJZ9_9HYPH
MDDAQTFKKALADIVMSAVLVPGCPGQEYVSTQVLDQARFLLDSEDLTRSAERSRSKGNQSPSKDDRR